MEIPYGSSLMLAGSSPGQARAGTASVLRAAITAVVALALPTTALAQPARLADLLREADANAFTNRTARASAEEQHANSIRPLRGLLPSARIETAVSRTTDLIGAFGTTLRQRAVTPAAFDPARLNNPAPITNLTGGLVLEVPVMNLDAIAGWRASRAAAGAAEATSDWMRIETRAKVVRAWFANALAANKVSMLIEAHRAAEAAVRQVNSMVQQGLVTRADALQASVRLSELAAEVMSARSDALTAGEQLALIVGRSAGNPPEVSGALLSDSVLRRIAETDTAAYPHSGLTQLVESRGDVRAASAGVSAARSDAQRAQSTLLPRINGFARYDWNSPDALYAGKPAWTLGVAGSWSLFGAGGEIADIAGANARARGAAASVEGARANARLEISVARRALLTSLERLEVMAQAEAQSREAARLIEKRYMGGLATVAERLQAESVATGASLAHAAARFAVIEALLQHRRAIGADPGGLALLDDATPSTGTDR